MSRRFLMISPYFAPHRAVGAKRTLSFARRLPAEGWDAAVVALPAGDEADPRLEGLVPDVPVDRCLNGGPAAWGRALGGALKSRRSAGKSGRTLYASDTGEGARTPQGPVARWTSALSVLDKTTAGQLWAVPRVAAFARRHGCELIYATSGPPASLTLGRMVKRLTGLPLVLDLRDPWSIEPNYRARWTAEGRALVDRIEAGAFAAADRVVLNTRASRDAHIAHYAGRIAAERFTFVRNFFDPDFFESPPATPDPDGPFRVVYFGHLRPSKNALLFMRALRRFLADGPPAGGIEVLTLGEMTAEEQAAIDDLGLSDVVTRGDWLPLPRALELLGSAHLLLDLMGPKHHLQISGKIYDYLAAGRPVLSISPNAEVGDILADAGLGERVPLDEAAIVAALGRALDRKADAGRAPGAGRMNYSAAPAAARMASIFDEALEHAR